MTSLIERPSAIPQPGPARPARRSWLLDFLPAMYAGDDFMNRFLLIFEDTLNPLQMLGDNLFYYFDPLTTSRELVPWLATWVSLTLDESWSLEQRRRLIHSASDLYSRRGTKRGLTEYLLLYTGVEPEISEYVDGMTLGPQTFLGVNTRIAGRERHSFTVTLRLPRMSAEELASKEASIRRIIESEKPAHTAYRLVLLVDDDHSGNGAPPAQAGEIRPEPDATTVVVGNKTNGESMPATGKVEGDVPTRRTPVNLSDLPGSQANGESKPGSSENKTPPGTPETGDNQSGQGD